MAKKSKKTKKPSSFWKLTTLLFFLLFVVMGLYHFDGNFNQNLNNVFNLETYVGLDEELPGDMIKRDGQIYVPYDDPVVDVTVIRDPKCKGSVNCDIDRFISILKRDLTPVLNVEIKNYTDQDARQMLKDLDVKVLPAFIFEQNVRDVQNYKYLAKFFREVNDKYMLIVEASKYLTPPELENVYYKGSEGEKINLVWYGNPLCKTCNASMDLTGKIASEYVNEVAVFYKYFVESDKEILSAAALECAGEQDRYFELYNLLFEKQNELLFLNYNELGTKITTLASELLLDNEKFSTCLSSEKYSDKVLSQKDEADAYGFNKAPVILINNKKFTSENSYDDIKTYIDEELSVAK